jgi:diaminopimelate epimerase
LCLLGKNMAFSLPFYKYHGAGNDFVMMDQRTHAYLTRNDRTRIAHLCDRRFGIGADGLILLQTHPEYGYEMIYFNSDGGESTLCGNGGRCFAAFAHYLGIANDRFSFLAIDGPHEAIIQEEGRWIELLMADVDNVTKLSDPTGYFVQTGSPHFVVSVTNVDEIDVQTAGAAHRYHPTFAPGGSNVNFVQVLGADQLKIRTYERGVEGETLACGTGVTAAALVHQFLKGDSNNGQMTVQVAAQGGHLAVKMQKNGLHFTEIWLCGPAERVFSGTIEL